MEYNKHLSLADFYDLPDVDLFGRAHQFAEFTQSQFDHHHLQYRRVSTSGSAPVMRVLDPYTGMEREMIYFASNDYLNLTRHPRVVAAGRAALDKYGAGAGSVPLLGGTLDLHIELEQAVAKFKGCESAIIFTSGFGSNSGALLAMLGEQDCAILDLFVHASIIDGCKRAKNEFFRHNDMRSLERALKQTDGKYRTRLVIVDGVYSMDGDIAHLDQIVELAHAHGAYVMIDEAHATGVIGANGRGTPEHFGLEGKVDIVAGTFSKALGAVGGFIAAKTELVNLLHFYSRSYMFSTAMTPQVAGSLIEALRVIQEEPQLRASLWQNIRYFRAGLETLGFNLGHAETAIFPIIVGDDWKVKEICRRLHEEGVYANPVLYPAVSKRLARIRLSLMTNHTQEHLDRCLNLLEGLGREYGVIGPAASTLEAAE
ncbi:MAG TPA: aminotransferase class I/II-fold pyridoxal phosphate-dependent enzyme [Symbiobacteriaceae bacterium]|nr:aminotransferase class I/II-fold pyridoxal phosphate-dependent enzyme [Symbiobacteriaceae bacterium]